MSVIKRGSVYHIDKVVNGTPIRQSLQTGDKAEAKRRADELIKQAWRGEYVSPAEARKKAKEVETAALAVQALTLKSVYEEVQLLRWSVECEDGGDGMASRWATLCRFMAPTTDITTINRAMLTQLVKAMRQGSYTRQEGGKEYKYAPATINRVLSLVGTLLTHADTSGVPVQITSMKALKFKEPKNTNFLTVDEVRAMFAALMQSDNPNHARCLRLFGFLLATGCRLGEALKLQWVNVDWELREATFLRTKSGKDVVKMLPDAAYNILALEEQDYFTRPFEGIGETMYRNAWEYAKAVAKIDPTKKIVRHTLRHTTASWLVQNGVSLSVVQLFLGHLSYQTTTRYAHLLTQHQQTAVARLDAVGNLWDFCGTSEAETEKSEQDLHTSEKAGTISFLQSGQRSGSSSSIAQLVERRTVNP